jgi:hypothetical protein
LVVAVEGGVDGLGCLPVVLSSGRFIEVVLDEGEARGSDVVVGAVRQPAS